MDSMEIHNLIVIKEDKFVRDAPDELYLRSFCGSWVVLQNSIATELFMTPISQGLSC